jgi:hypothetical protein
MKPIASFKERLKRLEKMPKADQSRLQSFLPILRQSGLQPQKP